MCRSVISLSNFILPPPTRNPLLQPADASKDGRSEREPQEEPQAAADRADKVVPRHDPLPVEPSHVRALMHEEQGLVGQIPGALVDCVGLSLAVVGGEDAVQGGEDGGRLAVVSLFSGFVYYSRTGIWNVGSVGHNRNSIFNL